MEVIHLGISADRAALNHENGPPENDEAPTVAASRPQGKYQLENPDYALDEARRKAWSNLVARAAMRGCALWRSDAADGPQRFFIAKNGVIRACDLNELDRLLDLVGVA